jgi:uncharacterized protein YbjT (DUF2867 family)
MKTALIAGATGLVGKACLYELLESNTYARVTALVRKPIPLKHHKLHQLVVDFDNLHAVKEELFANDVYCCLGTTIKVAGSQENFKKVDYYYPLELAHLTKLNGADTFLLISAMGADAKSSIFYSRIKGEVEQAIDTIGFQLFGIFRPSLLLGDRIEFRLGEQIAKVVMKGIGWLFVGPLKKYKGIQASTVAKAMVNAASLNRTQGKMIYENDSLFKLAVGSQTH